MSDALKIINNVRTLRAQARELTLDTLEEMLEKLTIVVEERREEEASFLKQQEEKQAIPSEVAGRWHRPGRVAFNCQPIFFQGRSETRPTSC